MRRVRFAGAVGLVLAAGFSLPGPTHGGAGGLRVSGPAGTVPQGRAVVLRVEVSGQSLRGLRVLHRPVGVTPYQEFAGGDLAEGVHAIRLPPEIVVAPGVEYYLRAVDQAGGRITAPAVTPSSQPYLLPVTAVPPDSGFELLEPAPALPFDGDELRIRVRSGPGALAGRTVWLLLDDTDLTGLARVAGDEVTLSTRLIPPPGSHTLRVVVRDAAGRTEERSWVFRVADPVHSRRLYGRGGVSFHYGRQLRTPSGARGSAANGNLGLGFGAEGEDWAAAWNGVNIQYAKDRAGDDVTLASGFAFQAHKGAQELEYGDVSVRETSLTAPSLARRGAQVRLRGLGAEVHAFGVSTEAVSGWNTGLGSEVGQVYGLSIRGSLLEGDGLPVATVFLTGQNRDGAGVNAAATGSASEGDVMALSAACDLWGLGLSAEVARSRFDPDTADAEGRQGAVAFLGGVSTRFGPWSVGTGYHRYGTDFGSVGNPNFTSDREGFSGTLGTSLGPASLALGGGHDWDNLERSADRPRVYSSTASVSLGVSAGSWPSLSTTASRGVQYSRGAPPGTQEVKNVSDALAVGLAAAGEWWGAGLSGQLARLRDEKEGPDSRTRGVALSGQLAPFAGFSVGPSASYTETESGGGDSRSRLLSLTASVPLVPRHVDGSLQVTHAATRAEAGEDVSSLSGAWRVAWNVTQFVRRWLDYGQQDLALSGTYDRGDGDREVTVLLTFGAQAPLDLTAGF